MNPSKSKAYSLGSSWFGLVSLGRIRRLGFRSVGGAERASDRVQGLGIDPVLLFENARRERVGVVALEDTHTRLSDDWSGVKLSRNEVDRASMLGEPLGERPSVGMQPAQVGQQRGVNIEHASLPSLDEGCAER